MNPALSFDFTVHQDTRSIHVRRDFAAGLDLVWKAWTTPELLDQWWAPKPYITRTKSMDFREGGRWLYAMISPEQVAHWCLADYQEVDPGRQFSALDAFCDESGRIDPSFPRSHWSNTFLEQRPDVTTVEIVITYEQVADLEKIIQMGFKEGFTMALQNLDQYLDAQFRLRQEMKRSNAPRVCTYVNFPGNTEEAFLFYRDVFGTSFVEPGIRRFGDLPPQADQPPLEKAVKDMVLHVELPLLGNHILMGTDAPKEMGFTVIQGNNMHISLEPDSRQESRRIFDALSDGGTITMPLQDMFWGAYFGSLTDRFGINWMVNCQEPGTVNDGIDSSTGSA